MSKGKPDYKNKQDIKEYNMAKINYDEWYNAVFERNQSYINRHAEAEDEKPGYYTELDKQWKERDMRREQEHREEMFREMNQNVGISREDFERILREVHRRAGS